MSQPRGKVGGGGPHDDNDDDTHITPKGRPGFAAWPTKCPSSPVAVLDSFWVLHVILIRLELLERFLQLLLREGVAPHVHHSLLLSVFPVRQALTCQSRATDECHRERERERQIGPLRLEFFQKGWTFTLLRCFQVLHGLFQILLHSEHACHVLTGSLCNQTDCHIF